MEKGVVALEDFVYSRFQIYQNMWSHKAVVSSKLLLSDSIKKSLDDDVKKEIERYLSDENRFAFFTDHFFLEKFRTKAMAGGFENRYLQRKKYKYLEQLIDCNDTLIKEKQAELEKINPGKEIIFRKVNIKFSKISEREFLSIRVLSKRSDGKRELKPLKDKSGFFNKFNETVICNFYMV